MDFAFQAESAKSKRDDGDDAPVRVPMAPRSAERRNPSTDQKKIRRQLTKKAALAVDVKPGDMVRQDFAGPLREVTSVEVSRKGLGGFLYYRIRFVGGAQIEVSETDHLDVASSRSNGPTCDECHGAGEDWYGEACGACRGQGFIATGCKAASPTRLHDLRSAVARHAAEVARRG